MTFYIIVALIQKWTDILLKYLFFFFNSQQQQKMEGGQIKKKNVSIFFFSGVNVFNRPCVAGADLQTPLSVFN